ncbi:hypothetical protein TWF730_005433 [Orbilia blumenaviensis]|uniref:Uncharacterized protein n=1 Tax=Orbilia blumenaviensis TaxID=1796055 RepID=A0AAV9VKQ9_9PEZI
MSTPTTSNFEASDTDFDQGMDRPVLTLNDPPYPGYAYIISYRDTPEVITYHNEGVTISNYEGKLAQRWVCHSKDGWLGFTNDPGETTFFMGYHKPQDQTLVCNVNHHKQNEMFCVRKKAEEGFQILMRSGKDYSALWPVGKHKNGNIAVVRGSDDWWGFTKTP